MNNITDEDIAGSLAAASESLASASGNCHVAALNLRAAGDDVHADAAVKLVKQIQTLQLEIARLAEKAQQKAKRPQSPPPQTFRD